MSKYFDSETEATACYRNAIESYLVGFGFTTLMHGHWIAQLRDGGTCSISWDGIRRDTVKLCLHKSFSDKSMPELHRQLESTGFYEDHFSRELFLIVPDSMKQFFHPSENIGKENAAIDGILNSIERCAFSVFSIPTFEQLLAYKEGVDRLAVSEASGSDYGESLMRLASKFGKGEIDVALNDSDAG